MAEDNEKKDEQQEDGDLKKLFKEFLTDWKKGKEDKKDKDDKPLPVPVPPIEKPEDKEPPEDKKEDEKPAPAKGFMEWLF